MQAADEYDDNDDESAASAAEFQELKRFLSSYEWRLKNLYKIKDVGGNAISFKPNWAQWDFLKNIHYFNVILKARQLGFSTLISIHLLDSALFNDNYKCGVIAQDLKAAQEIFDDKIKFGYDNLPEWLKNERRLVTENTEELEFSNGSKIIVGLSLRSGTFQRLHVSEYGKVSAKFPDKAKEIKTGALNTVHAGQQIFVESTAEGQSGEFYELVKLARKLQDEGRTLNALDPKFHFYPWHRNPDYVLDLRSAHATVIEDELQKYFSELETEHGIFLTIEQKAWYVTKERLMQEDMRREFPSTPDESFAASLEGAIYARQMRILRKAGGITKVPYDPRYPVHTFWDFGNFNYMAIWFFQQINREWRMIRFYQDTSKDFSQYVNYMKELEYNYGDHYLPHDGEITRLGEKENKTYKKMLSDLGLKNLKVVPRTNSVRGDIETVCKPAILMCVFDEVNCAAGIKCLDNYRKQQNKDGIWLDDPRHDEFSDGCDAFRTFAMGYKEKVKAAKPVSFQISGGQGKPL